MNLKLCYIWIREFRGFQDTGFNFSSSEKFKFDSHSNYIHCDKINDLPIDFFGSSITDVTALIGRNGSGKSNALELVCKLLKGGKSSTTSDFLIITEEDGQRVCYNNLKYNLGITSNISINIVDYNRKIDPLKIIYFSNVFDQRIHNFDRDISDISNNYRYPRSRYKNKSTTDFQKQIIFIESEQFKYLNIDSPNEIRVTNKVWNNFNLNSSKKQQLFGEYFTQFNEFSKYYKNRISDFKDIERLYSSLIYSLIIEVISILNSNSKKRKLKNDLIPDLLNIQKDSRYTRVDDFISKYEEWLMYSTEDLINFKGNSIDGDLEELVNKIKNLINARDYLNNQDVASFSEGRGARTTEYFRFQYRPQFKSENIKYLSFFEQSSFFNINWTGISSGHKAYLNLFSLLHFELKKIRRENVLICIDEGDLYLHPQWQIEFFDKLITIVPQIFKGKIQIILTSHSPFLLSDLPKQCVTTIDLSQENQVLDGTELKNETFAGNIYKLYSEPFFLGNQRLSVFAKRKIDRIFEILDSKDRVISSSKKTELGREINLIGDDVIRFHLIKMLNHD